MKKLIYILLYFLFFPHASNAQEKKDSIIKSIDRIIAEINTKKTIRSIVRDSLYSYPNFIFGYFCNEKLVKIIYDEVEHGCSRKVEYYLDDDFLIYTVTILENLSTCDEPTKSMKYRCYYDKDKLIQWYQEYGIYCPYNDLCDEKSDDSWAEKYLKSYKCYVKLFESK